MKLHERQKCRVWRPHPKETEGEKEDYEVICPITGLSAAALACLLVQFSGLGDGILQSCVTRASPRF